MKYQLFLLCAFFTFSNHTAEERTRKKSKKPNIYRGKRDRKGFPEDSTIIFDSNPKSKIQIVDANNFKKSTRKDPDNSTENNTITKQITSLIMQISK